MPLLVRPHRAQAQRYQFGQLSMVFEHARDQLRALGRGHLSDMKRIDDIEVELDGLCLGVPRYYSGSRG